MNPVVFSIFGLSLRAFPAAILVPALVGAGVLAFAGRRRHQTSRWLDVGLAALIGGLVGARIVHIILEWPYFSANPDQVLSLAGGGLAWQGAVWGGTLAAWAVARLRGVDWVAFADRFTLIFPLLAVGAWAGCGASACAYGVEVRTLADYPRWLVTEALDIYGQVAPRLDLPSLGAGFAILLLAVVLLPTRRYRFWISLAIFALGMFVIGFFRADYVPVWFGRRADQILDLGVFVFAALALIRLRLRATSLRQPG